MANKFVAYLWGIETMGMSLVGMKDHIVCSLPMRDWNRNALQILEQVLSVFVAYLWGIETEYWQVRKEDQSEFVAYLWGIETRKLKLNSGAGILFVAYLWGIETGL